MVTDACDIAKTAGTETVNAFKDMKSRYDEDPEGFKSEVSDNLADMTQGIVKATQDKTEEIVDRIKSAYSDFEEDLDYDASEDKDTEENDSDEEDNDTASVTDEEPAAVIDEDQDNKADAKDSFTGEDEAKTDSDVKSDEASDRNSDDEAQSADGSFKLNYVDDKDTSSNVTITEDAE